MDKLIKNLKEIVKPLTEQKDIIPDDILANITEGYEILINQELDKKDRIQLSCDIFDEAQYNAYSPFHARVQLSKAIAIQEIFSGKQFERTKKLNPSN